MKTKFQLYLKKTFTSLALLSILLASSPIAVLPALAQDEQPEETETTTEEVVEVVEETTEPDSEPEPEVETIVEETTTEFDDTFCDAYALQTTVIKGASAKYSDENQAATVTIPADNLTDPNVEVSSVGLVVRNSAGEQSGSFLWHNYFADDATGTNGFSERPLDDSTIEKMAETWGQEQSTNGNDVVSLLRSDLAGESTVYNDESGNQVFEFVWQDQRGESHFGNTLESIVYYRKVVEDEVVGGCTADVKPGDSVFAVLDIERPEIVTEGAPLQAGVSKATTMVDTHVDGIEGATLLRANMVLNYFKPSKSKGRVFLNNGVLTKLDGYGSEFMEFFNDEAKVDGDQFEFGWRPTFLYPDQLDNDFYLSIFVAKDGVLYQTDYVAGGEQIEIQNFSITTSNVYLLNTDQVMVHRFKVPQIAKVEHLGYINNYGRRGSGSTGAVMYSINTDPNCQEYFNGQNTWGNKYIELVDCRIAESPDGYLYYDLRTKLNSDYPVKYNFFAYHVRFRLGDEIFEIDNWTEDDSKFLVLDPVDLSVETTPEQSYAPKDQLTTTLSVPVGDIESELTAELGGATEVNVLWSNVTFNRGSSATDNRCFFHYNPANAEVFSKRSDWTNEDCTLNAEDSEFVDNGDTEVINYNWSPDNGYYGLDNFTEGSFKFSVTNPAIGSKTFVYPYQLSEGTFDIYPQVTVTNADEDGLLIEGESTVITFSIPKAFVQDLEFDVFVDGTASLASGDLSSDVAAGESGMIALTIPAGETETKITLTAVDDADVEDDEPVQVGLTVTSEDPDYEIANASEGTTVDFTIVDNDEASSSGGGSVTTGSSGGGGGGGGSFRRGGSSPSDNSGGDDVTLTGQSVNPSELTCDLEALGVNVAYLADNDPEMLLAADWACVIGLLQGDELASGERRANLNRQVNRAEFVTFIARSKLGYDCELVQSSYQLTYTDIGEIPHWYSGCLAYSSEQKWFNGDLTVAGQPLNTFRPESFINVAEVLSAVARVHELPVDGSYATAGDSMPANVDVSGLERTWMQDSVVFHVIRDLIEVAEVSDFVAWQLQRGEIIRTLYRLEQAGLRN